MQYRFNRNYFHFLLEDSLRLYGEGVISREGYDSLSEQIEFLIGTRRHNRVEKLSLEEQLEVASTHLMALKQWVSSTTLESLLNISEEIVLNTISKVGLQKFCFHTKQDIIDKVLTFYMQYDIDEFNYLNHFMSAQCNSLEIVSLLNIYRHRWCDATVTLPYYNLKYVIVMNTMSASVYGSLVHEFGHIVDKKGISSGDFNILNETNPIFKELLFNMQEIKFTNQIIDRLNALSNDANVLFVIMQLLKRVDPHNPLTLDMIGDVLNTGHFEQIKATLCDIADDCFGDSITYTLGTLLAIHLCNISLEDRNEAMRISNRIKLFLDKNIVPNDFFDLDIGLDLKKYKTDLIEYKKFVKRYSKKK